MSEGIRKLHSVPWLHRQAVFVLQLGCMGRPVTKQQLTHWIVDLIVLAYAHDGQPPPSRVVAHSTRGMAASWALFKAASLEDVCDAAAWASSSTFDRFYILNLLASTIPSVVLRAVMDG